MPPSQFCIYHQRLACPRPAGISPADADVHKAAQSTAGRDFASRLRRRENGSKSRFLSGFWLHFWSRWPKTGPPAIGNLHRKNLDAELKNQGAKKLYNEHKVFFLDSSQAFEFKGPNHGRKMEGKFLSSPTPVKPFSFRRLRQGGKFLR